MRAAKADANQPAIVAALEAAGATVQHLHRVGEGCPDLAVGHAGKTYLIEVKDGSKPPSAQKLNKRQEEWFQGWKGHAVVVNSPEAALAAIGLIPVRGTVE